MKVKLYKPFQHWYHGGIIWVISDLHAGDVEQKKMIPSYLDGWKIADNIISKAGKKDTVIILGDIVDEEVLNYIKSKRKCIYIVVVLGNHDKGASNYEKYADEVYEGILAISDKILLSHEPVDLPFMINIHGHDHANKSKLNVAANLVNYMPQRLDDLVAGEKRESIHRAAIDKAIERKKRNAIK